MDTNPPLVCSLEASGLTDRLAEIASLGRDGLLSSEPGGALRFRAEPAIRRRLEAVIAAESRCCAFLRFDLREDRDAIILRIAAPPGAEAMADDLAAAFAGEAEGV